jgi:hypothetical protein
MQVLNKTTKKLSSVDDPTFFSQLVRIRFMINIRMKKSQRVSYHIQYRVLSLQRVLSISI